MRRSIVEGRKSNQPRIKEDMSGRPHKQGKREKKEKKENPRGTGPSASRVALRHGKEQAKRRLANSLETVFAATCNDFPPQLDSRFSLSATQGGSDPAAAG